MKTNHYEMVVWWSDQDHAYMVDVPELAKCVAQGSTRQRAVRHAEEAIAAWLKTAKKEGRLIPEPTGKRGYACAI